ncbi:MAG TPA: hypothetical protein GXZ43_06985 [Clostridiaceae bacterium]|nr:hypothetical protein [Clostridiaceae bacterium]
MQAFVYLKVRTLINWFKQLKEKPSRLLSILFYLGLLGMIFLIPKGDVSSADSEFMQSENSRYVISIVFFGILLIINAFSWNSGTKRGVSIFTLPDTQFLFTSPFKPASVLLYGMLNQLKTSLLSSIFLLYQIPNLSRLYLSNEQIATLFAVWILTIFSNHIISAFIYAISYKSDKYVNIVQIVIYAIPILSLLSGLFFILKEADPLYALIQFLQSEILYLVPGAGWAKAIFDLSLLGFNWMRIIGLTVFIIVPVVLMRMIYKMDIDYYEDALSMVQATPNSPEQQEIVQEAQRKAYAKFKVGKTGINKGSGENTIFYKQLCEYRRTRPRIVGFTMITTLLILGGMAVLLKNSESDNPLIYWGISIVILFFSAFNSTTLKAFAADQFFTLPGKSILKVVYSGILGILLAMLDQVPAYLFVVIYSGFSLMLLPVGILLSGSIFMVINSAQILTYRIFGEIKSVFSGMILLTFSFIFCLPGTAMILLGGYFILSSGAYWGYLLITGGFIVNCLLGLIGIYTGKKYLEEGPAR